MKNYLDRCGNNININDRVFIFPKSNEIFIGKIIRFNDSDPSKMLVETKYYKIWLYSSAVEKTPGNDIELNNRLIILKLEN